MTKSVFSQRYDLFRQMLIQARFNSGLTQSELAKRLLKPQSFVSKYERGERRLDVVEFLDVAEALAVDELDFFRQLNSSYKQVVGEEP